MIAAGAGTSEPIPPRGKVHMFASMCEGMDFWYMGCAIPSPRSARAAQR